MLVLVALLIPVVAVLAAFAVDLAWIQLARTELRTATDAAARAGGKALSLYQDVDVARDLAIEIAARNEVTGRGLSLRPDEIEFGSGVLNRTTGRFEFTPGVARPNSVRVVGNRTGASTDGPVGLFFGQLIGLPTVDTSQVAVSTVLDRDICIVIDRSGSMGLDIDFSGTGNGQNCGPLATNTRFYALVEAIGVFLGELDATYVEERVALASYSSRHRIDCVPSQPGREIDFQIADVRVPLTDTYADIDADLDAMIESGIGGRTAIGRGLQKGIEAVTDPARARPLAVKTIILMTDGRHNLQIDPVAVAPDAAALDITVHTVTFSPNADKARMIAVADATGGIHLHADSADELVEAFREIARTLPVLLTE